MNRICKSKDIVGGSYDEYWKCKRRYRVVKGGRGSKKSTTTALWFVWMMMMYYHKYHVKPCVLVLRRYFCTHATSTFNQLVWAINRLGVSQYWKASKSPLQLTYMPSGQAIYFRGLDDAMSINSIVAADGFICWTWWEEAYQITNEDDFNKIDLSIRGQLPAPLFKQHTLTLNPWSDKHWIKRRFFDVENDDVLAITRNYDCNEFLAADDIALFERMRIEQPRRYAIEGRGEWGVSEGLIFENWEVKDFDADMMCRMIHRRSPNKLRYRRFFGMDFGFSNDPTAFVCLLADEEMRELYVCAEFYIHGMVIEDMYNAICRMGCQHEDIVADSASPLIIEELRRRGISRIHGAKKGANSIKDGIAKLQDYKIYIHPTCKNTEAEFSNYCWKTDPKTGAQTSEPIGEWNHIIDAIRYATESLDRAQFSWARL